MKKETTKNQINASKDQGKTQPGYGLIFYDEASSVRLDLQAALLSLMNEKELPKQSGGGEKVTPYTYWRMS